MDFLSRHKKAFIVTVSIVLIIMSITTMILRDSPSFIEDGLGFVLIPVQSGLFAVKSWVSDKVSFVKNITELEKENQLLRLENDALESENRRLKIIEEENIQLNKLFEIKQRYAEFKTVGAQVIAKDPGNWYDAFVINKGRSHGLEKNMVVLAEGGLVGRIIEAGATYSKVVSLIDDQSTIAAKVARTQDLGFVRGDMQLMAEGFCKMDNIEKNSEINEGDEIITSHLSSIYPPGITIGYVREVKTEPKGLTKYALIEPVVDFKYIEHVLIVLDKTEPVEE